MADETALDHIAQLTARLREVEDSLRAALLRESQEKGWRQQAESDRDYYQKIHDTGYAVGRKAVCDELRAAVARFNDDDSLGIGQLIEVISPWLEEEPLEVPGPVLLDVLAERAKQDAQWGGPAHDDTHGLRDWFFFINHQMANHSRGRQDGRAALVKIAALAIAGVESLDRKSEGQ